MKVTFSGMLWKVTISWTIHWSREKRERHVTSVDLLFIKCNKNTIWCKIGPPAVSRLMWKGLTGLLRNISVHFKSCRSLVSQLNVWTLVQGFVGKMSFKGLRSTTLLQSWRIKRPLKSSKWFQRSKLSKERKLDVRLNLFFRSKTQIAPKTCFLLLFSFGSNSLFLLLWSFLFTSVGLAANAITSTAATAAATSSADFDFSAAAEEFEWNANFNLAATISISWRRALVSIQVHRLRCNSLKLEFQTQN